MTAKPAEKKEFIWDRKTNTGYLEKWSLILCGRGCLHIRSSGKTKLQTWLRILPCSSHWPLSSNLRLQPLVELKKKQTSGLRSRICFIFSLFKPLGCWPRGWPAEVWPLEEVWEDGTEGIFWPGVGVWTWFLNRWSKIRKQRSRKI